jgi:phage-related protein
VRAIAFGDGYEQRAPDGLNSDMRTRALSFSGRSAAEMASIKSFIEAQGGTLSFDYTHPGDISRKYVCKKWTINDAGYNIVSITADFQQVPM